MASREIFELGAHAGRLDAVRDLRTKAGRSEAGRFCIEGPTMLAEAIAARATIDAVYCTADALRNYEATIVAADATTFRIPDRAMSRLSDLESPPGILGVIASPLEPLASILRDGRPALVLAGLRDPGNAGTLWRSAEFFGIDRLVFTDDAVEPLNPKVVRATMGAIFRTRVAVASASAITLAARTEGYCFIAAGSGGSALANVRLPRRALIAIGNERHGVDPSFPDPDLRVTIPKRGGGESLNAAVAGSIILYAFSQHFEDENLTL